MSRKKDSEKGRADNGVSSIYFSESDGNWHGWVTVGVRDDGRPDRRHRMSKDEKTLREKVSELEKQRSDGAVPKAGPDWTVESWLTHWVENIAKPSVRYKAYLAYKTAVYKHLIPGLGGHRMLRIQPENFEKFYAKMHAAGYAPASVHQVYRTARTAFGVAYRRRIILLNVVELAEKPKLEEREIEPPEVEDMKRIIVTALRRRNGVRFVVALAQGYRQGESLGLTWARLDMTRQKFRKLREQVQRRTWEHGCDDPHACGERLHKTKPCPKPCARHTRPCPPPCGPNCTRHASSCPERRNGGLVRAPVKSKAGQREGGIPDTLFLLLLLHKEEQDKERQHAGTEWQENDLMFCQPNGRPIDPRRDLDEWKSVLAEAGVELDDDRLHAARHAFATLLNELEVNDRTTQSIMGWADASQAKRYQKTRDRTLRAVADKIEIALFGD